MTIPVPLPPNPIDAAKAIVRTVLWGLLVLIFLVALGYAAYLHWRAGQAADAIAAANTALANAASGDVGAANATTTRASMDSATIDLRVTTEAAAGRIEHASHPADDQPGAGDDVVRELEDAEGGYRAAADRLQRARGR